MNAVQVLALINFYRIHEQCWIAVLSFNHSSNVCYFSIFEIHICICIWVHFSIELTIYWFFFNSSRHTHWTNLMIFYNYSNQWIQLNGYVKILNLIHHTFQMDLISSNGNVMQKHEFNELHEMSTNRILIKKYEQFYVSKNLCDFLCMDFNSEYIIRIFSGITHEWNTMLRWLLTIFLPVEAFSRCS